MTASALIFRFRMILMAVIIFLGFWAPWVQSLQNGSRVSLLVWLALELSRSGVLSFTVATPVVIIVGTIIAATGFVLRVWASAWLGPSVVVHPAMRGAALTADGPYRHLRNPLYLGMYCWVAAMSLLMPASGALFTLIAVAVLNAVLIAGEESFLTQKIGAPYLGYLRSTPRLFPRLRSNLVPSGSQPRWGQAFLSELFPLGVLITIGGLSWTYDHDLMIRAIIVAFGVSIVARALVPRQPVTAARL